MITRCDDAVLEFKTMVRALHAAGIEVILDVVFNHTAEGNETGPLLSLRGIDNSVYYRLNPADSRFYENLTGCGNTVNCEHPRVRALIIDCLKYWVEEMHVDGFRFDLATVLGRDANGFNAHADFFKALRAEPALAYVKLIAEPWDLGLGRLPARAFPGRLVRVERPLSRYRARILARRWRQTRRVRGAIRRLQRCVSA